MECSQKYSPRPQLRLKMLACFIISLAHYVIMVHHSHGIPALGFRDSAGNFHEHEPQNANSSEVKCALGEGNKNRPEAHDEGIH